MSKRACQQILLLPVYFYVSWKSSLCIYNLFLRGFDVKRKHFWHKGKKRHITESLHSSLALFFFFCFSNMLWTCKQVSDLWHCWGNHWKQRGCVICVWNLAVSSIMSWHPYLFKVYILFETNSNRELVPSLLLKCFMLFHGTFFTTGSAKLDGWPL